MYGQSFGKLVAGKAMDIFSQFQSLIADNALWAEILAHCGSEGDKEFMIEACFFLIVLLDAVICLLLCCLLPLPLLPPLASCLAGWSFGKAKNVSGHSAVRVSVCVKGW
jgi:hypothetical protein